MMASEEVGAEEQLDPGSEHEALAVLGGLRFFALLGDAIFGRAHKGALDAEEGFHHGLGVGDGEADAESHEEGQIEEGLHPGLGEEHALARRRKTRRWKTWTR